jgi:hypothetical protein
MCAVLNFLFACLKVNFVSYFILNLRLFFLIDNILKLLFVMKISFEINKAILLLVIQNFVCFRISISRNRLFVDLAIYRLISNWPISITGNFLPNALITKFKTCVCRFQIVNLSTIATRINCRFVF